MKCNMSKNYNNKGRIMVEALGALEARFLDMVLPIHQRYLV